MPLEIRTAFDRNRRGVATFAVLAVLAASMGRASASPASAPALRVCPSGCRYTSIAPAVAAAGTGATVIVGRGTYHGGFTIDKSVSLVGAGAALTRIRGGGPVITVGMFGAASQPTVDISGVTITGGVTRASYGDTYQAVGGGIWVPPAANDGLGATLTVGQSVITGNRATPTTSVDSGISCPTDDCRFAQAGGGGIDSWGTVTLDGSVVQDNVASGAATSDADGAGIYVQEGGLTLVNSVVAGNRAVATTPDGRFAEGGGIMVDATFSPPGKCCTLAVRNSAVRNNSSVLTSTLPSFAGGVLLQTGARAGGIDVGDGISTTIDQTTISGNVVSAVDPNGEPSGIDAGMIVGDSALVMQRTVISGNRATTTAATSKDVGSSGSALELDGPGDISNTKIVDNTAISTSVGGAAATNGGLAVLNFNGDPKLVTVEDSIVSGNLTEAFSSSGSATVQGGGVLNDSLLLLRNVEVTANVGRAQGRSGSAQGAGIWNGVDLSGPPVRLTLDDTTVARNILLARGNIRRRGGGLFTTLPVHLMHSRITHNRPDQCTGCGSAGTDGPDRHGHRPASPPLSPSGPDLALPGSLTGDLTQTRAHELDADGRRRL